MQKELNLGVRVQKSLGEERQCTGSNMSSKSRRTILTGDNVDFVKIRSILKAVSNNDILD